MNSIYSTEPISEFKIRCKKVVHPWVYTLLNSKPKLPKSTSYELMQKEEQKKIVKRHHAETLLKAVCDKFKATPEIMGKKSRENACIEPRQAYYYLLRKYTSLTLREAGKSLGLRQDHSTVVNAVKRVEQAISIRDGFGLKIIEIIDALK